MSSASLEEKNLQNLSGDFKNANLQGAKFINCTFVNADFRGASLENASFTCCEISDQKVKSKISKKKMLKENAKKKQIGS